ncbi:hypothetical protein Q5752_000636 [Cryptotrichosporon argae]
MEIRFESFAELVYRLGHPPASLTPSQIFSSWLAHLRHPLPPHTGKQLFRLLFPHEGARRRYDLKETRLVAELERVLGVAGLRRWDSVTYTGEGGTGCLGLEVERAMEARQAGPSTKPAPAAARAQGLGNECALSVSQVDRLLDRLAASPWSQLSQAPAPGPDALERLYRDAGLSPRALGVLTQIILRDLRPLLCPLPRAPVRNPTAMLRLKTTDAPAQLSLCDAMRCWDRRAPRLYRTKGNIDWCLDGLETGEFRTDPVLGVNIQIPNCQKGRSIEDALRPFLRGAWAETKHDGYRMQIHVDASASPPRIAVFSKSKRDSTQDRLSTHSIILAALGLPFSHVPAHPSLSRAAPVRASRPISSVVLEAEMVPYNEGEREGGRGPGIEEFWWIERAIHWGSKRAEWAREREQGKRHLCLVFFDCLYLNGESLLDARYDVRRLKLEQVVDVIPGFSHVVERTYVSTAKQLKEAFRLSNDRREEGLVLKAPESTYNSKPPWVKLKKDYIPGLGDSVDLVLLGASWDADRARELRVDTSVFTTFHLGVLANQPAVAARQQAPSFTPLFSCSYGPSRAQLEVYNENIRLGRWRTKPWDRDDRLKRRAVGLSWTCDTTHKGPSVVFENPMCAEVMGAGFQRVGNTYKVRWPRLMKIYDPKDRPWVDALDARQYLETVHRALGYAPPAPAEDSLQALWRSTSTVALTDIPDSPPATPGRSRSEPQLRPSPITVKMSPRSPMPPGASPALFTPSPKKRDAAAPALAPVSVLCASKRLRAAQTGRERLKPLSLKSRLRRAKAMSIAVHR